MYTSPSLRLLLLTVVLSILVTAREQRPFDEPFSPHTDQQAALQDSLGGEKGRSPLNAAFAELAKHKLDHWHVPGVAVGVVDADKEWFAGYGIASYPSTPVTPQSLFLVGSTTKAFTASAMSLLISSSANSATPLTWTTPISTLIRDDFVLPSTYPYATTHTTLEDALSHRTGMGRHDLAYGVNPPGTTPRDLVRSLRYLPFSSEPRTKMQYCNLMYVVVAHVIETLTGLPLREMIQQRILNPLGMNGTFFEMGEARESGLGVAEGYYYTPSPIRDPDVHDDRGGDNKEQGQFHLVPDFDLREVSGAGFIVSNVVDYAKWLRMWLSESDNGPIPKANQQELKHPRILIDTEDPYVGPSAYALGWFTGTYRGHQWWQHSGGMEAYSADVIMFPDLKYGLVAFGNTGTTSFLVEEELLWELVDDRLGVPNEERFNWTEKHEKSMAAAIQKHATAPSRLFPPSSLPSPSLPFSAAHLSAYTGTYHHPGYNNLTFFINSNNKLQANRSSATWKMYLELEHVSGDWFLVRMDSLTSPGMEFRGVERGVFRLGAGGEGEAFGVRLEATLGGERDEDALVWFERVEG